MKRVFGAALVLAMMLSVTSIAFAETGSIEVGGHILGTDNPVAQYHITYHANGGSGRGRGSDVPAGGTDTVCSLSGMGITRFGYSFTGWNTREDGRGISYTAGDSITLNSSITLYAQWRKTAGGGGGGTSLSGSRTPWSDGTTIPSDEAAPASDGTTTQNSGTASVSPNTGAVSNMPLCVSLLCVSLAAVIFLLWAMRREKRLVAQAE